MSKTLSTNVANGKAGDSIPVYLLELDSNTTTYRWSTLSTSVFPTAWSGPAFSGDRLARNGLGRVRLACNIALGGNIGEVGGFNFKIVNADLYYNSLMAAGERFEGMRIELRLIFADKTAPSWANALPLFRGFVETLPEFDYDIAEFKCIGSWLSRHRMLPKDSLTRERFQYLPEKHIGDPLPLFYGDYSRGLGINRSGVPSNLSPSSNQIIHRDYFPLKFDREHGNVTGGTNANDLHPIICGHDIHTSRIANSHNDRIVWDEDFRQFQQAAIRYSGTETFGNTYPGVMTHDAFLYAPYPSQGQRIAHYPQFIPEVDLVNNTCGEPNAKFAVDEDDSNYTTLDANGEIASYITPIRGESNGDTGATPRCVLYYWIDAVSRVDDTVQIQVRRQGTVIRAFTNASAYGSLQSVDLTALSTWDGNYGAVEIQFKYVNGGAGHDAGCEFRIRAVYLWAADLKPIDSLTSYDSGKGRKFGTWIDGADHSNAFGTSDLIVNPAYVIESLLADELGLTVRQTGAAIQCNDNAGAVPFFQAAHSTSLAISGAITIELWVKLVSIVAAGQNHLIGKINGGATFANPYSVRVTTAGKLRFYRGDGASENYVESTKTLGTGTWYHIVCVADGGSNQPCYIYIDGILDAQLSPSQTVTDGGSVLRINQMGGATSRANAIYDEIRIWNTNLSVGQVGRLYNGGSGYPLPFLPSNTMAWWRVDELLPQTDGGTPGASFTLTDQSGNSNTASSNNHAQMRWVTGASAKVNYTDSQIFENGGSGNADHSFDNLASNKASWKCARHTHEDRKQSREFIKELVGEFCLAYHQRYDGRESVSRIDPNGAPATLSTSVMLLRNGQPTFKAWLGPLTEIRNYIYIRYRRNHASGEFEGLRYCTSPDQSVFSATYCNLASSAATYWQKCRDSYTNWGVVNRLEINCYWIRDDVTAELLLKFLIDKLTRRPFLCSFEAPLAAVDLELLDTRKINHPLLPVAIRSTNHFKLTTQEIIPNEDRLYLEWLDVGTDTFIPTSLGIPSGYVPGTPGETEEALPSLWLRASALASIFSDGDQVDSWTDDSDNAWVFTSPSGGESPLFKTNRVNGHPTVEFDGVDDYMNAGVATLADIVDADAYTMFVVGYVKLASSNDATVSNNECLICDKSGAKFGLFMKSAPTLHVMNNDGSEDSASITFDTLEFAVITAVHDGTGNIQVKKNDGVSAITATASSGTTADLTNFIQLGANPAVTAFFNGQIAEVIVYPGVLTSQAQTWVCDYLRTKYDLY